MCAIETTSDASNIMSSLVPRPSTIKFLIASDQKLDGGKIWWWEGMGTRLNHVHHVHQRLHVMPVYWWSGDALEMLFMSIMCPSWDFLLHSLLTGVSSSVLHHSGDTIYILLQLSTEHRGTTFSWQFGAIFLQFSSPWREQYCLL